MNRKFLAVLVLGTLAAIPRSGWSGPPEPAASASPAVAAQVDLARRNALIEAWYRRIFHREAGASELHHWQPQPDEAEVALQLVRSWEAQRVLFGAACTAYLGRPWPRGEETWKARAAGRTQPRAELRRLFAASDELWQACGASRRALVERMHAALLGRPATAVEADGWALALERGLPVVRLSDLIADSTEGRLARARAIYREVHGGEPPREAALLLTHQLLTRTDEELLAELYAREPFLSKVLGPKR